MDTKNTVLQKRPHSLEKLYVEGLQAVQPTLVRTKKGIRNKNIILRNPQGFAGKSHSAFLESHLPLMLLSFLEMSTDPLHQNETDIPNGMISGFHEQNLTPNCGII